MSCKDLLNKPEPVIQRWATINALRNYKHSAESLMRRIVRLKLKLQERKKRKVLRSTFETTVKELGRANRNGYFAIREIHNIALFFLIAERDLQSVKIDALTHPDEWKRNFSLRAILLILHEWDMSKVASGKIMSNIYETAGISNDVKEKMISSLRKVNKAHIKSKKILSTARHSAIAHRDADAISQYRIIRDLDTFEVMNICAEFYEASRLFFSTLPELLNEAGSFESLLKQYTKKA